MTNMQKAGVLSMSILIISTAVVLSIGMPCAATDDFNQEGFQAQEELFVEGDIQEESEYYEPANEEAVYPAEDDSYPEQGEDEIPSDEYKSQDQDDSYPDQNEDEIPESGDQAPDVG